MPDTSQCPLFHCGWSALEDAIKRIKPSIIYDLGANDGGLLGRWLACGAEIHAFEPLPDMAEKIRSKFGLNKSIFLNEIAVSDNNKGLGGVGVFNCWTLLPHGDKHDKAVEYASHPAMDIKTITLDTYVEKTGRIPQLVKVDVDGYELKVLKGGVNLFTKHRPPMLFEYSYLPKFLGDSIEEMCHLIYSFGYEAVSMNGAYRCPDAADMIRNFPEHSSYDIMLLPK